MRAKEIAMRKLRDGTCKERGVVRETAPCLFASFFPLSSQRSFKTVKKLLVIDGVKVDGKK
jgi:hypothetical protein